AKGAGPRSSFGQAVIGPPGSGKTTYCLGMQQFLSAIGRKVAVVNLDPANEGIPYPSGSCSSGGFTLLHRPRQIHLRALHFPVRHAARGAASCQRALQDGLGRTVWETG
uniref:GPN-loop GTPase 2 n=1 Tax=Varanus komodoensis TaxID=61221 RepID=A0A8D2JFH8_VARKO